MASILANIKRDPKFLYLLDYYSPEEAAAVVASGIAINRVGIVPSLQVPPGNRGCEGLGLGANPSLLDVAGDISAPVIAYNPNAVWASMPLQILQAETTGTTSLSPGGGSPGAQYPTGMATPKPDTALDWVEDNWLMIAGGLGLVLVASMLGKR